MSTKLTLLPATTAVHYSRDERIKIKRLAAALQLALNIHPGSCLVMVLGHGGEANNLEALETWVMRNLEAQALPPGRASLQPLLSQLEAYLTNWNDEVGTGS